MEISTLKPRQDLGQDTNISKAYLQYETLLKELSKRKLPEHVVASINKDVEALNAMPEDGKLLAQELKSRQARLVRSLEKELKLVPKAYYRNIWLGLGMASFGIPIGVAFGLTSGNMAFLGIGLPLGLGIGSAVGTAMDKKALAEGRQLDLEIKS